MNTTNAVAIQQHDKLYLFTLFDVGSVNQPALERYLTDARTVASWSYPLPSMYFLRCSNSAESLRIALKEILGNQCQFLVAEAVPGNIDGSLHDAAWQWLFDNFADFRGLVRNFALRDEAVARLPK